MVQKRKIKTKNKNKKRQPSLAERRRTKRIVLTLVSFAFLIASGYGVSKLSFSPNLSLSTINIEGANLVSEDSLKSIVEKQTASSYLGLFSKKNVLFLPRTKIEEEIVDSFKTVKQANVSFNSLRDITVDVSERVAHSLWCESTSEECFYVDKSGYIFAEAPKFSGGVFLIWRGFIQEKGDPVAQHLMSQQEFEKLNTFIENVSRVGFKPVSIFEVSENELEIRLSRGGTIVVSRDIDYRQTLDNLESIVSAKQLELKGAFFEKVDRIDIRFSGKAFVKLKAEQKAEEKTEEKKVVE